MTTCKRFQANHPKVRSQIFLFLPVDSIERRDNEVPDKLHPKMFNCIKNVSHDFENYLMKIKVISDDNEKATVNY